MKRYIYPAIFTPEDGGFCVRFPDLDSCYTEGDTLEEALENARDVLCHKLYHLEQENRPIPSGSPVPAVSLEGGAFISLVDADTLEYRKFYDNHAVKKTLTVPAWLNAAAEQAGLNFSRVLQEGLKKSLGVQDRG